MADGITINVTGLVETQEMLNKMSTKSADKIVRKALRAGAKFEQAVQASAAPVRPDLPSGTALPIGALSNDVGIRVQRNSDGTTEAIVGPNKATLHAANWVEYGHRLVRGGYSKISTKHGLTPKARGPGTQVGFVPAHPYIRPAWEASVERVVDIITVTLKEEVTKAAAKGGETI